LAAVAIALVGALFAGADAALTSLSPARLGALAKETDEPRRRKALERLAERRNVLLARYLVGRVLALSGAVALFTAWLIGWSARPLHKAVAAVVAFLVVSALTQCTAMAGRSGADWLALVAARFLRPFDLLLAPVAAITRVGGRLLSRPSLRPPPDARITETEVEMMVNQGERSGLLEHENAEMIRKVLEFSELTARDAMVPRTRVVSIDVDTPLDEVLQLITETGHSRYPVYREQVDEVFGLLYAKDLFRALRSCWRPAGPDRDPASANDAARAEPPSSLRAAVRTPINFVSESQPLSALLIEMRQKREHLAVVVNEFGEMSGIVTLEDVLEEIVGDIQDESDPEEAAPIADLGDGRLLADAAVLLCDLSAYLGTDIDPDGQYDSLGGMITDKLGQVPPVGTTLEAFGLSFTVREADEKRVRKVEIVPPPPSDSGRRALEATPSEPPPTTDSSPPAPSADLAQSSAANKRTSASGK